MTSRRLVAATLMTIGAVLGSAGGAQAQVPHAVLVDDATTKVVLPGDAPGAANTAGALTVTPNAVWVTQHRAGEVDRIDPTTNRVVARISVPVPGCRPEGCLGLDTVVGDKRNAWVVNYDRQSLVHIDARTNKVVGEVPTTLFPPTPIIDGDTIWAALSASGDLVQIDGRTHEVVTTVPIGVPRVRPLAIVGDTLWAGSYDASASPDRAAMLYKIDPDRGKVTARMPGFNAGEAVALDGDVWLYGCAYMPRQQVTPDCGTVRRIDGRTGALKAEVGVGGNAFDAALDDGTLFVRSSTGRPGPQWITAIDTTENRAVTTFDLGSISTLGQSGLDAGAGALWVGDWNANAVYRVTLPLGSNP